MKIIKVVTIDDNKTDLQRINSILKRIPDVNIIRSFNNLDSFSNKHEEIEYDIIFSDIEVENKNSIDIMKNVLESPNIVFISSYPKYAHKSFSMNPIHYIVKPASRCEVLTAIDRFKNNVINQNNKASIFVKKLHSTIEKIYLDNIMFIEANKDSVRIKISDNREIQTLSTIKNIYEKLSHNFIRVHRSFIINLDFIKSFNPSYVKIEDYTIPISRAYRKESLKAIHQKVAE
tara:strand:- start:1211 stop:1906 length:696 start_codon:yes stop_codon:yes gene_type:complete